MPVAVDLRSRASAMHQPPRDASDGCATTCRLAAGVKPLGHAAWAPLTNPNRSTRTGFECT